jgi:hypothetical protein
MGASTMNSKRSNTWQWDNPTLFASAGFVLMTMAAVGQMLRASSRFADVFKELGVQLLWVTQVVLSPWIHVTMGVTLFVPLFLRHRAGWKPWATAVWVVIFLMYLGVCNAAFFEPLLHLIDNLGKKASD